MSGLAIKDVTKRFGDFTAVDAINLGVPHGTFVCLLGPSGCGKTTLLRMIAGLEEPTSGAILLDDQDITPVPTHKRNLGMVFQSLALFPHLSVGDNIAYALRIRGASREEQAKRVDELLKMVHLPGFADRPVAKLSGGQRQRVAIARALALRQNCSCSTSRCRRSTPSCARPCKWSCANCSSSSASPRSSSPMTSAKP